jgi:hypothetical protein
MPFFTIFDFHCNGYFHASDYAQGAGWCRPGISPDPFDTGRLTSTDAQWIVRCCCFRQQQPTEDDGASPLFFPFLLFYFLSTRHNTQSTTVSKSHECPPFINCCLCTGVCIHPLYWHGVFSLFSFLRRTSSKKKVGTTKSCRTNDSGCACMEVMPCHHCWAEATFFDYYARVPFYSFVSHFLLCLKHSSENKIKFT